MGERVRAEDCIHDQQGKQAGFHGTGDPVLRVSCGQRTGSEGNRGMVDDRKLIPVCRNYNDPYQLGFIEEKV